MSDPIYRTHRCGGDLIATYTEEEWNQLPFVGVNDAEENGDKRLELRLCVCGSTLSKLHEKSLTAHTAGYQCIHGRPVQLEHGLAVTLCWQCPKDPAFVQYRPVYKLGETPEAQMERVAAEHAEPH
jgi:hypothetical protein